jgi:hypothetical protein
MGLRQIGRALLWAPLALALSAPVIARADISDAEKKTAAQALFDEARKLTDSGDFASACPKFAESRRLDPTMGTTFYLADCLEHVGKLASAWSYYLEVADSARASGQQERASYARGRAEGLKPRLPSLVVSVSPDARVLAGLEVKRNGISLGEAQWGTAIPVDLGEHVVSAAATGKERWETRVVVSEEAKTVTVDVPLLKEVEAAPLVPTQAPVEPALPVTRPPPAPLPPRGSAQRIEGIAVGAAGVVGLGLGAIFGLQAISKQSESDEGHCDAAGYCDDIGLGLRQDAISAATISTVGFIAGGLAVVGGAALYLTAAPSSGEPAPASQASRARSTTSPGAASSARVQIVLGLGGVSLFARF